MRRTHQSLSFRPSGCSLLQPEARIVRSVRLAGAEESAFRFLKALAGGSRKSQIGSSQCHALGE
jgi:hypothetical protein